MTPTHIHLPSGNAGTIEDRNNREVWFCPERGKRQIVRRRHLADPALFCAATPRTQVIPCRHRQTSQRGEIALTPGGWRFFPKDGPSRPAQLDLAMDAFVASHNHPRTVQALGCAQEAAHAAMEAA